MPNPIGFTQTKELQKDPLHKEHKATWYAQWKVWRQTTPSLSQYKSSVDNGRVPQSMDCSLDVSHITSHIIGKQAWPLHCMSFWILNVVSLIESHAYLQIVQSDFILFYLAITHWKLNPISLCHSLLKHVFCTQIPNYKTDFWHFGGVNVDVLLGVQTVTKGKMVV